jgi:hypothetical protein
MYLFYRYIAKCLMIHLHPSAPTSPTTPLIGLSVCTKEEEDHIVDVIEDIENHSGNLIIRGNLDLRRYSVPQDTVVSIDGTTDKILLDMTRDDFIKYEEEPQQQE